MRNSDVATTKAFQLSMISSSTPRGPASTSRSFTSSPPPSRSTSSTYKDPFSAAASALAGASGAFDVSSSLISNLAVVALKMRLATLTHVSCDVTSKSSDLLIGGFVGPVTVKGRGWQSRLGLSCRAIEATVNTCELDLGQIVTKRKLRLTKPAEGKAMIALNAEDFGNFITHPLIRPPSPPSASIDDRVTFHKDGIEIDPHSLTVVFKAEYAGKTWDCTLKRGVKAQRRAIVGVRITTLENDNELHRENVLSMELTESLTVFFNTILFELDGVFLSFRDMLVTNIKGSPQPCVMLSLDLSVHKFPSTGAEF